MTDDRHAAPRDAHRRAFDQFWWQMPERQNRTSSSWWFFILFPEGEDGYGPRQLMFTIAAGVGDRVRVNDTWIPGMSLDRSVEDGVDRFEAISVGWYADDRRVQDPIVHQPATARLSREGALTAWVEDQNGDKRGGEIRGSADRSLGLDAHFVGDHGAAHFEAWGELGFPASSPAEVLDVETVVGGAHLATWQCMNFEGTFDLPYGRERLEGLAYFHRACLNLPLFPWKWVWAFFPDGSAFSAFIPYLGPQLFRNGYGFFSSDKLERATLPVGGSARWYPESSGESVEFDKVAVRPVLGDGAHPDFSVRAESGEGEHIEFRAASYGHVRNTMGRPLLGGRTESHWSYNEYLFRMEELRGHISGEDMSSGSTGQGFGTLEYAWGLGL